MTRRIEKVAVIGSGIMGGGIAALCASAGIPTLLLDIVPFNLSDDEKKDPKARNKIVEAGLQAQLKAKPAAFMDKKLDLNLLTTGNLDDDFDKLAECDIIFEVVIEDLKIKQDLYARVEKIRKPGSIIASNTSGLPIKEMAAGRSDDFKKHFMITHFFNPVRYMKLLECVAGEETEKEICDFVHTWGEKMLGKGMVWGKDTPNFIGNRIGVELICEAFKLIDDGVTTIPEADAMFGKPMGMPNTAIFGLADLVGNDTIGHLSENSFELLTNDEYREIYNVPKFFKDMLDKKMFGNKTKENGGFYLSGRTPEGKRFKKVIDPKTGEFVDFDRKAVPEVVTGAKKLGSTEEKAKYLFNNSEFAQKLVSSMCVYSANRVPEIADTIVDIDNAMKWGYAWELGPFEVWDALGIKDSFAGIEAAGFTVPASVKKMVENGGDSFYCVKNGKKQYWDFASNSYKDVPYSSNMIFLANLKADDSKVVKKNKSVSLIDLGDGVFNIEFHTKMNAINGEIVDFLPEVADYIKANGVGVVIGNQAPGIPGAFSAGGDLGYMSQLAKAGKFKEIDAFIKKSQEALFSMKYTAFPVVAAPYGMTLGGGCETCLAADKIVAHAELYMGLVEIGAGLLPAGGGCTNLWRRFIESASPSANITDLGGIFLPVFQNIAMAKVSMSAAEARKNGFLKPTDRIVFNKDYLIGEAKKEVLRMIEDGYTAPVKTKIKVMGYAAMGMIDANVPDMLVAGHITPHMAHIAKTIGYVISGGEAKPGSYVSEDYMLQLEREAFVELWKTENSQKMAEHMFTKGKPLMI